MYSVYSVISRHVFVAKLNNVLTLSIHNTVHISVFILRFSCLEITKLHILSASSGFELGSFCWLHRIRNVEQ